MNQKELSSSIDNQVNIIVLESSSIKWNIYNYPAILKLIHYDPTELTGTILRVVKFINLSFFIIFLVCCVNCNIKSSEHNYISRK